jgi:hypothetical protein
MPSEAEPPHSPTWNSVKTEVQPVNARRESKGDVKYPKRFFALTRETPKLLGGQDTILTKLLASSQEDITTEPESDATVPQNIHKLVRPQVLSTPSHYAIRKRQNPSTLACLKAENAHLTSRLRMQKLARRAEDNNLLQTYRKIFELEQSLTHLSNRVADFASWGEDACGQVASMQGRWQELILYWARELSNALPENGEEEESSEDSE